MAESESAAAMVGQGAMVGVSSAEIAESGNRGGDGAEERTPGRKRNRLPEARRERPRSLRLGLDRRRLGLGSRTSARLFGPTLNARCGLEVMPDGLALLEPNGLFCWASWAAE